MFIKEKKTSKYLKTKHTLKRLHCLLILNFKFNYCLPII